MHYFMIEATPQADNKNEQGTGGTYVSCWINFKIADGAEVLALYYIQENGWIPGEVQERQWVEQEDYQNTPDSLPYFLEAEQDGASFVFYRWPEGEENAD